MYRIRFTKTILTNGIRKFSTPHNFKKTHENCENCNTCKTYKECSNFKNGCIFGILTLGGITELYTFNQTKDVTKSFGLGWAFLAVMLFF